MVWLFLCLSSFLSVPRSWSYDSSLLLWPFLGLSNSLSVLAVGAATRAFRSGPFLAFPILFRYSQSELQQEPSALTFSWPFIINFLFGTSQSKLRLEPFSLARKLSSFCAAHFGSSSEPVFVSVVRQLAF